MMFDRTLKVLALALGLSLALAVAGQCRLAYPHETGWEPPTLSERQRVEAVRRACRHDGPHVDPWAVLRLVRLEETLGVTEWRPGLLGAVWCVEGGLRLEARRGGPLRGDYRDGVPMAHGPFQLWLSSRAACGGSAGAADDLEWSARCWVARVEATLPKARRACPRGNAWMVAEAAVSNVRKYRWDCRRGSEHWRLAARTTD